MSQILKNDTLITMRVKSRGPRSVNSQVHDVTKGEK